MSFQTTFTAAVSVDTWDAHFRWRTGNELRDRTVDATWRRVASAVSGIEKDPMEWEQRFVDAFRNWRMLPDVRLLKWAGTGLASLVLGNPRATLNLGSFIVNPKAPQVHFDYRTFDAAAALAVRFLDDTWLTYGKGSSPPALHVGVMGFADALASLGFSYASEHACEFASEIGRTLSTACMESSLRLAQERGHGRDMTRTHGPADRRDLDLPSFSMPRHPRTTAIHAQHLIALFANQASDALDPLSGSGWDLVSHWRVPMQADPLDTKQVLLQQIRVRGRMQPWIDAPIDYPLVYIGDLLNPQVVTECRRSARMYRLPEPRFRRSEQSILGFHDPDPHP